MNILVTGATGFLGSHLLPELLEKENNIIVLKRSFSDTWRIKDILSSLKEYEIDKIDLERVFQDNSIDVIIHLATDYGKKNNNNIIEIMNANVVLPSRLLELGTRHKVKAFINADTSINSLYSLYSASKKSFLEIAKSFSANYEIKFINIVLEYMYGERDDDTKFIPFVIESILNGSEINATGGEQKRDFIYVKDIVKAYLKVLGNMRNFKEKFIEFSIGTGQSISLREFISLIEKAADRGANINWGVIPYKKNEIFDSKADIRTSKRLLDWQPSVSWKDGLRNVINWYKLNTDKSSLKG
ncbi:MAG: NAD-dependent epimerase/dehydratase family protein [Candidatus Omnitrophica bacterium]|nr:NAD-dependent epimerase/dehydratase family protein [Candidatus Omnitrophota bacterium]